MLPLQTVFHRLSCIFPAEVDAGLARPTIVARKMPRCGETGVPPTSAEPYPWRNRRTNRRAAQCQQRTRCPTQTYPRRLLTISGCLLKPDTSMKNPPNARTTTATQGGYFLLVGATAAAVHFAVLALAVEGAHVPPLTANVFAFAVAFTVSFAGHYRLTFRHSGVAHRLCRQPGAVRPRPRLVRRGVLPTAVVRRYPRRYRLQLRRWQILGIPPPSLITHISYLHTLERSRCMYKPRSPAIHLSRYA